MTPAERITQALVELDDLGVALQRWDTRGVLRWRLDDLLTEALRDLEQRRPHDLTPGQELMARLDARGLSASPWSGPTDDCPPGLRAELEKVEHRTEHLRRMQREGRWAA